MIREHHFEKCGKIFFKYMGGNPADISMDVFVYVSATTKHDNYKGMNTTEVTKKKRKNDIFSVIACIIVVMFRLMTFTIKSEYERWFEIGSGIILWLVILYGILNVLNIL